ncbi:hypothetical protein V1511DRAFT_512976 [Dipodascopsis uninucleata]
MSFVTVISRKQEPSSSTGSIRKRNVQQVELVALRRATNRRLAELERENYHDGIKIDVPRSEGRQSSGKTAGVRKLLASKKTITNLFDEDEAGANEYYATAARPSTYPSRALCSVCGYWGDITCMRCKARYCSLPCEATHRETRCLKVYA